jgi:hypothetical protein
MDGRFLHRRPNPNLQPIHQDVKRSNMSNETETQQDPKTSETKPIPSPGNQSQGNRPQDISKKNPSQDTDAQHQGEEKPEDEKRRAS